MEALFLFRMPVGINEKGFYGKQDKTDRDVA